MPSTPRTSYAAFILSALSLTGAFASTHAHGVSLLDRKPGNMNKKRATLSYSGCYSSSDGLTEVGTYTYQSSGYCQTQCVDKNQAVLGLSGGNDCWCGDSLPEASSKVSDSKCNTPCTGYGQDDCGGTNYWSVYLTGTESDVPNYSGSASSSAASSTAAASTSSAAAASSSTTIPTSGSSTTTSAPSTVITSVSPGTTIIVTEPARATSTASATPSQSSKSGGSNTAGIAAGVVVGVVAAAAIIAAIFFWIRHKKKQEAEAGYKPGQDYKGGDLRPPPTAYSQMSDSRLDPEAGRRNSSGSIADDQDYSRRILRVANPSD